MIRSLKNLQRIGALVVIMGATLFVYWPAQRNGFVWDDTALVQRDPFIRSWRLILEGFGHFLFTDATASSFYRPLQRLSFTFDYAVWDRSAGGWHLTSVYLHLAAACALFFLCGKLLPREAGKGWAAAIAGLWAIHPLHTSAVTYIAGRADPLQALFGFTGLGLALVSLGNGRRAGLATAGASACFLAALLSKEAGAAALLIWFLILAWRRVPRPVWGKWIALAAVVLGLYGALRFTAERTSPPAGGATPWAARPLLVARAFAEYAGLIIAPVNLRMERDVSSGVGPPELRATMGQRREWQTLLGFLLIGGAVCWWRWAKVRAPVAALGLLAALAAYLPVSNLFSLNATVAEHWLYVPLAFVLFAAALTLRQLTQHSRALAWISAGVVGLWAIWLGARTWQRQEDWKDQRTFLTRTIESGGDSARMRVNLGQLESASGRDDLALEQFRLALRISPDEAFAQLGAAATLLRLRQFEAAEPLLAKAAQHPLLAGEALHLQAALDEVRTGADPTPRLREAAQLTPNYWPAWRLHFAALERLGNRTAAIRELGAFLEQQPFRAESWELLGDWLAKERDYPRAIAAFTEATRLDVHDAESRARLAILRRTPPLAPTP